MSRALFASPALDVAPRLLGARLSTRSDDGTVTIRITEVEAYHGLGTPGPVDPGSHARMGQTARNASMFGPPGHAYVYFTYGMHYAVNLVCGPENTGAGVLVRSGEVVSGHEIARNRRAQKRGVPPDTLTVRDAHLARGPGNLAAALGINREHHDGRDLFASPFAFQPAAPRPARIASGPRVGVSGEAGGSAFPWRFWIPGDPTVSAYRAGKGVPQEAA